ncbi:porin family protein [Bdellovibrio bacteriovorus]|uniref:porin family protein n=1 Tax=Bdellovibrio bacteriovorus TaxID=959 RepID=UPI0021CFC020|nr:porin family protein [Bdellovibrio bacteriovorus]UXR63870.1 porin family protein [Bdellovibrio bacteriovorus]
MIFRARLFTICLLLSFSSASFAATVSAVKGQRVLINLDGDTAEVGDEFYLINPDTHKRIAIIRIKQIKPGKALGDVLRGKAVSGSTLQAKAPSSMSADVTSPSESSSSVSNSSGFLRVLKDSWGVTGGYLMSTMDADITYRDPGFGTVLKTSASMAGSGFGVGGFYDYALNSSLVGRGAAGIEQFNVTGSASSAGCQSSTNCDAKINYLSLYGLLKWYPLQDKYRVWVGGGMGYLLALSKSSSALNESQISTNQVFTVGGGVDVQMSRKNYVPISIEYNMFPPSDTVKASMISIKAGWAWNL